MHALVCERHNAQGFISKPEIYFSTHHVCVGPGRGGGRLRVIVGPLRGLTVAGVVRLVGDTVTDLQLHRHRSWYTSLPLDEVPLRNTHLQTHKIDPEVKLSSWVSAYYCVQLQLCNLLLFCYLTKCA